MQMKACLRERGWPASVYLAAGSDFDPFVEEEEEEEDEPKHRGIGIMIMVPADAFGGSHSPTTTPGH